jgi:hypothetical protein
MVWQLMMLMRGEEDDARDIACRSTNLGQQQ